MIQPILVFGVNRSGTKWLSNILGNHSSVLAPQSEFHRGIIECNLLGTLPQRFGSLDSDDTYYGLLAAWAATDLAKAIGITHHELLSLPRSNTYFELIDRVMTRQAQQQHKPYWLLKASPAHYLNFQEELRRRQVHIVTITRDAEASIASQAALRAHAGLQTSQVRLALWYGYQIRYLEQIQYDFTDAVCVSYEDLRGQAELTVERICERIGLDFQPAMLNVKYEKNTSFQDRPRPKLSFLELWFARVMLSGFRMTPPKIVEKMQRMWPGETGSPFVVGSYQEEAQRAMRIRA